MKPVDRFPPDREVCDDLGGVRTYAAGEQYRELFAAELGLEEFLLRRNEGAAFPTSA